MKTLLDRLEAWFVKQGTTLDLAPPAGPAAIAEAEKELGFALPPDYRELLAVADGQNSEQVAWLPCGGRLHGIADCVENWRDQQGFYDPADLVVPEEEHQRYNQIVSHPRWLPIGGNEFWDGDNLILDMFPAAKGREGQLVGFLTECDVTLLGDSVRGFLERYLALIEAGVLVCRPVEGQDYAHEVLAAEPSSDGRWDELFDPRNPVRTPAA
jgi:cell wall assembly regulator SMI1